uniref:Uncharacterized protein n=1 Tax=Glossina brevipalpis TaxID=37001 RepID=A0A1A9WFX7_9MUSC
MSANKKISLFMQHLWEILFSTLHEHSFLDLRSNYKLESQVLGSVDGYLFANIENREDTNSSELRGPVDSYTFSANIGNLLASLLYAAYCYLLCYKLNLLSKGNRVSYENSCYEQSFMDLSGPVGGYGQKRPFGSFMLPKVTSK